MRRLAVLLCLSAGGCDLILGLDRVPNANADATAGDTGLVTGDGGYLPPDFEDCRGHLEFTPLLANELLGLSTEYVPTLRADYHEAYDVIQGSAGFDLRRWVAGTTGVFAPSPAGELSSPGLDDDPALSADGLVLDFVSDRGAGKRVYEATRDVSDEKWNTPALALGLETVAVESIDLSPDGDQLYVVDGAGTLHQAVRPARNQAFVLGAAVGDDIRYPTLSADGLELISELRSTPGSLSERNRTTTKESFGPATLIGALTDGYDADLTPDGHLLLTGGGKFYRRACH